MQTGSLFSGLTEIAQVKIFFIVTSISYLDNNFVHFKVIFTAIFKTTTGFI